jgi:hypothetical protein
MKLSLPSVSINSPTIELAERINDSSGILIVTDLPKAPFGAIRQLIQHSAKHANRLNKAYPKNLVYKDSFASGHGGPSVGRKRVLDLSPERLDAIEKVEPCLFKESRHLKDSLQFWESLQETASRKILPALALAIGSDEIMDDVAFNYRMVDYYEHNDSVVAAPRCGEHRDFGSFTLIQSTHPGLQVHMDNKWHDVPLVPEGSAILIFGWCTQIRSNDRIPALLHKVDDDQGVKSRASAILFCAPKKVETPLEPVVTPGESQKYIGGIKVGQLRGKMARKWRYREGTLSDKDRILEEEEIRLTNMMTQDHVVDRSVKV